MANELTIEPTDFELATVNYKAECESRKADYRNDWEAAGRRALYNHGFDLGKAATPKPRDEAELAGRLAHLEEAARILRMLGEARDEMLSGSDEPSLAEATDQREAIDKIIAAGLAHTAWLKADSASDAQAGGEAGPCERCGLDRDGFGYQGMLPAHTCSGKEP